MKLPDSNRLTSGWPVSADRALAAVFIDFSKQNKLHDLPLVEDYHYPMRSKAEFRRRVLLVDRDEAFLRSCSVAIRGEGYHVITAEDGFKALQVLRGASPDAIVSELNLPHMSGFELLAVVRKRFPQIAVIALSDEYTMATVPNEAICDFFIAKGNNNSFELIEKVRELIGESPLRGSRPRAETAPVWIPRSPMGYVILTCPECLRSFSANQPESMSGTDQCVFCSAEIKFQISSVEQPPTPPSEGPVLRSRKLREHAREIVKKSQSARKKRSTLKDLGTDLREAKRVKEPMTQQKPNHQIVEKS